MLLREYAPGIMLKGERGLSEPVIPGDPSGRTADSMVDYPSNPRVYVATQRSR